MRFHGSSADAQPCIYLHPHAKRQSYWYGLKLLNKKKNGGHFNPGNIVIEIRTGK